MNHHIVATDKKTGKMRHFEFEGDSLSTALFVEEKFTEVTASPKEDWEVEFDKVWDQKKANRIANKGGVVDLEDVKAFIKSQLQAQREDILTRIIELKNRNYEEYQHDGYFNKFTAKGAYALAFEDLLASFTKE